jgi:hypothetical protein
VTALPVNTPGRRDAGFAFIHQRITATLQQAGPRIQAKTQKIVNALTNLGPYAPIPKLLEISTANKDDFGGQLCPWHLAAYVQGLQQAILNYKNAVDHSTRINEIYPKVHGQLAAYLPTIPNPDDVNRALVPVTVCDAPLPNTGGTAVKSLNQIADWWTLQRRRTQDHINEAEIGKG